MVMTPSEDTEGHSGETPGKGSALCTLNQDLGFPESGGHNHVWYTLPSGGSPDGANAACQLQCNEL